MRGSERDVTVPDTPGGVTILAGTPGLTVAATRLADLAVLEVRRDSGDVVGHFDLDSARLHIEPDADSAAVAAAVTPYLLGSEQPLGELSSRHVVAAETLWRSLESSGAGWQRSVLVEEQLLLFYCPPARLALEIIDAELAQEQAEAPTLAALGISLTLIPLIDIEQRCATIADWLGAVCAHRAARLADANAAGSDGPTASERAKRASDAARAAVGRCAVARTLSSGRVAAG